MALPCRAAWPLQLKHPEVLSGTAMALACRAAVLLHCLRPVMLSVLKGMDILEGGLKQLLRTGPALRLLCNLGKAPTLP